MALSASSGRSGYAALAARGVLDRLPDRQVAVAAGPVRAAETGMAQPDPGAEHDDAEREQRADQAETAERSWVASRSSDV